VSAFARLSGLSVLSLRGVLPLRGPWAWEVELDATDAETPVKGSLASLTMAGRTWSGYVAEVAPWAGRARLVLEAGSRGMRTPVEAQGYRSALVSTLIEQAVQDAGELLAPLPTLTDVIESWTRPAGAGSVALGQICDAFGLGWRFTDAGLVQRGAESWPELSTVGVLELQPDGADGSIEVAPLVPSLSPGWTWNGRRVERVIYHLPEGQSLTARLVFAREDAAPQDIRGLFRGAVRAALPELAHAKRWPCRVAAQGEDGRLELVPDDAAQMPGTPPAPPLYGLPGVRCEVPEGARVGLVHDGADPARPRAEGWEAEGRVSLIELASEEGGVESVHRVGDGGTAGMFTALLAALIYQDPITGAPLWSLSGTVGGSPVQWAIVPVGSPEDAGKLKTKALEGSAIVKAGGAKAGG
jgi:hypothetical protein